MAKKKNKPQVINHIQEMNLEIDYDKLAEAIIRAQEKHDRIDDQESIDEKTMCKKSRWRTFWYNAFRIIINDSKTNHGFLPFTLVSIIQTLFNLISVFLVLVDPCIFCFGVRRIYDWVTGAKTDAFSNIVFLAMCVILLVFCPLFALIFRGMANEIEREEDKNYIISVFSGLVSLVALIVAIIALFKGVG